MSDKLSVRLAIEGILNRLGAGRGGVRPAGADCADVWLRELSPEIRSLSTHSEELFLRLSRDLQQLQARTKDFVGQLDARLQQLRAALDGVDLSGRNGLAAQTTCMAENLGRMEQDLGQLRLRGQEIARLGVTLEVCRSVFAVQCGSHPEHGVAFEGFLSELSQLSGEIVSLGEAVEAEARQAHGDVARQRAETISGLRRLKNLVQALGQAAEASGETITRTLEQTKAALDQVGASNQRMRRSVSDASYYMQFGDIVRQRIEHVDEALHWSMAQGSNVSAAALLDLQSAQMQDLSIEVIQAAASIDRCLDQLETELQSTRRLLDGKFLIGTGRDSSCAQLRQGFVTMAQLSRQGREMLWAAQTKYRRASASALRLGEYLERVRSLNHRMHLQSLNAIVKSEGLGPESGSLGVLAFHVHDLFLTSNDMVSATVKILEDMREAVAAVGSEQVQAEDGCGESIYERVVDQLEKVEQGFRLAGAEDLQSRSQLEQMRATKESLAGVRSFAEQTEVLSGQLRHWRDAVPRQGSLDFEALLARYTMESERRLHAEVLAHWKDRIVS